MRNYIELDAIHADLSTNHNYWGLGRSPEEAKHIVDQAIAGYGATLLSAQPLKVYFELNKDNFYNLMWSGANFLYQIGAGVTSYRIWHDGNPSSGGYVVNPLDQIEFESPRGAERRRFRLVPIGKRA